MAIPFNVDEVFEMAEQIERNGAMFYRAAAEKFPAISELFQKLAVMEDEHQATFASMRADLAAAETEQPVYDPDSEAHMYLRVMADGHVFDTKTDPTEKLGSLKDPIDVIDVAIGAEKDSITFYMGLKECVSKKAGKEKVDAIIREELSHISTLSRMMGELK